MANDSTKETPRLLCLRGGDLAGKTFELSGPKTFGRSNACDIVMVDEGQSVSRQHGRFEKEGDSLFVVDLGSTNGVFVNGQRVQRSEVRHGDIVRIGSQFEFQALLSDAPTTQPGTESGKKKATPPAAARKPGNPLTQLVLPVLLVGLALFALITSFQKRETRVVSVIGGGPYEWKLSVPSTLGLPWEATGEIPVGVTLNLPFLPTEDPFLYRGERLGGQEEVYHLSYLETSGEVLIKDRTQVRERVGFFVDIATTRNEDWNGRSLVEFEGDARWAGSRRKERTKANDPVTVDFKGVVWEPSTGARSDQSFQVVESYTLRDSQPTVKLIELYAELPYRRVVVGAVCRANREDVLFDQLQTTLRSIQMDPNILHKPPSGANLETARYWIDQAEKGSKTLDQAPENLYRVIHAYRSALWFLPSGFADGTIDRNYLTKRLKECCESLTERVKESEARIAANQMIGRRKAVVEEVAALIRRIPEYRDERVYPLAGRYYEVRDEFPNLPWIPKVLERVEWQ